MNIVEAMINMFEDYEAVRRKTWPKKHYINLFPDTRGKKFIRYINPIGGLAYTYNPTKEDLSADDWEIV